MEITAAIQYVVLVGLVLLLGVLTRIIVRQFDRDRSR